MPKMKTNRATAKRFRKTGSGRLRRNRGFRNHLLTKKRTKRKRQMRRAAHVHRSDAKSIKKLLPYP
jgi:large subunit ribosomal protein L35